MLTKKQQLLLKDFYRALEDKPLEPEDDFYVPFLEENDAFEDPVAELATRINWSESHSVSLLTGQRGVGKSTELRRLSKCLADCEVFLCDMRDYLNLTTPVEITDFLVSVMGALSEAVSARFGKNPGSGGYLERFITWLQSDVELGEIDIGAGAVGLKASLRENTAFKQRLQDTLRGHVSQVIGEAHGFAAQVVQLVRQERGDPDRKVVLLVDSVEHLRGVGVEDAERVYRSAVNLFSGHGQSLIIPMLHVLYTIPPYLTPLAPGLGSRIGGGMVCNLPSMHVRDMQGKPDDNGLAAMEEIITRRNAEWRAVFASQQLRRMALSTGGDLRDFFRLVRQSLIKASNAKAKDARLPVDDLIIDSAETHLRSDMLPIAKEDRSWLARIADTKQSELDRMTDLHQLARFFDTNLVMSYRNGDEWYDVHPLLAEIIRG